MVKPKIKYETVLWTFHLLVTSLAIIDRFTTNFWPRQSFQIGQGSAGNDRMEGFKEGPWSVVCYDILARVSGRFSIVCFNFMLITRLVVLEQFLASSWIASHLIDCTNIAMSNMKAHEINGIALCVLTLIHVWSILIPCKTHGWKAQVVPGVFEYPLSERTPPGFKDADAENKIISLQVDDIFRMVEMTLLLGVLMPLSIRWMQRMWHLGIQVHRFIAVLYFVDIVRRHSHPHSWVLNTPIFVIWILDKIITMTWRHINTPGVTREIISSDYMCLYWDTSAGKFSNNTNNENVSVGSNYYIKLYPSSWMETRHPFTAFKNRSGNCDFMKVANGKDIKTSTLTFTNGAVIRVFHNDRKSFIGKKTRSRSHTEKMAGNNLSSLRIWGPYQGRMSNLVPKKVLKTNGKTVVLVGSGSAINFMIDLMSQLSNGVDFSSQKEILLLYSTRDEELHNWVYQVMSKLLTSINNNTASHDISPVRKHKIAIVLACTNTSEKSPMKTTQHTIPASDLSLSEGSRLSLNSLDSTNSNDTVSLSEGDVSLDKDGDEEAPTVAETPDFHNNTIELRADRIDYALEIPNHCDVFCQGSSTFKDAVKTACNGKNGTRVFFDSS